MSVETITSRQNPLMTHLRKLGSSRSYRVKSGEYLCDGTKLLQEALKWSAPVKTALFSEGVDIPELPGSVRAVRVSEELMRSVSPMETPQGALFTVFRREAYSVTPEELFALLQKSGVPLYGTALRDDTVPLAEADLARAAVAIGSEGRGLSQQLLDACAKTLKIPMSPRCESLNAAIAAAVVLWEMYR